MKNNKTCSICGRLLTVDEFEEFEDECFDCVFEQSSGLISDEPETELDFEKQ